MSMIVHLGKLPATRLLMIALALALTFALPPPAQAATIVVNATCSFGNAISSANNDTATGGCSAGSGADTISLTGDISVSNGSGFVIGSDITIEGNGHTITSTHSNGRHFIIQTANVNFSLNNVTLTGGDKTNSGGSIFDQANGVTIRITNTTFHDNESTESGGAIRASTGGSLIISNSTFSDNVAGKDGGAINTSSGVSVTISNSRFSGNRTTGVANDDGGAIYFSNSSGALTISDSTFENSNTAAGDGGDINIVAGTATISRSVFDDGDANNNGGSIDIESGATVNIRRSTFESASVNDYGGAIHNSGTLTIENSTFFENAAADNGGAVYSANNASTTLRHVTMVDNRADGTGNAIYTDSLGDFYLYNSIIDSSETGDDCDGYSASIGNLITDNTCMPDVSDDPSFAALTGSPAYFPLHDISPAIDAADASQCAALSEAIDQRGVSRPQGSACDIGAYEYFVAPPGTDSRDTRTTRTTTTTTQDFVHTGESLNWMGEVRLWATNGLRSGVQFQRVSGDEIGIPAVLELGVLDAIDVWAWVDQGVEVCFFKSGSLLFLDSNTIPRSIAPVRVYIDDGLTCAYLTGAGTIVLVSSGGVDPKPTIWTLQGCLITTIEWLNHRATPGGPEILAVVPNDYTLSATARSEDWFQVTYNGRVGWVSADWVTTQGACHPAA